MSPLCYNLLRGALLQPSLVFSCSSTTPSLAILFIRISSEYALVHPLAVGPGEEEIRSHTAGRKRLQPQHGPAAPTPHPIFARGCNLFRLTAKERETLSRLRGRVLHCACPAGWLAGKPDLWECRSNQLCRDPSPDRASALLIKTLGYPAYLVCVCIAFLSGPIRSLPATHPPLLICCFHSPPACA